MQSTAPPLSAPLVWVELITSDVDRFAELMAAVLGWKPQRLPGMTDTVVYLDHARMAGPICGLRPRTPHDPRPEGWEGDVVPDRWTVRLAPPRPPQAADPFGDQLLRPRAPGPRIGRWAAPSALCFAELLTPAPQAAREWMERRLDACFVDDPSGALLMRSSVDPERTVAAVLAAPRPQEAGWVPAIQVGSLELAAGRLREQGVDTLTERPLPPGCAGSAALDVLDSGGSRLTLVEHGPQHGRR